MKKFFKRIIIILVSLSLILFGVVMGLKYINSKVDTSKKPLILSKITKKKKVKSRVGSYLKLKNIHFRLSDKIDLYIKHLTGEAIPKGNRKVVDFDDVNSFAIDVYNAEVKVPVRVMEYIFNEVIFNYKGSSVKNIKMSFVKVEKGKPRRIKTTGEMKLGPVWLSFEALGVMKLDPKRLLLILEIESVKTMGNPASKTLMDIVGLTIDKFIGVAKGRGVTVYKNQVIVEPFKLFPPPELGGYLTEMKLLDEYLYLKFGNSFQPKFGKLPARAKNYLMVHKGKVKFGKLTMDNARLLMVDKDPKDYFDFYLKKYFKSLIRGSASIKADGSVVAKLPDYK